MHRARRLRIALSAVIEDESGRIFYWALKHAPDKPDFHHAAGFIHSRSDISMKKRNRSVAGGAGPAANPLAGKARRRCSPHPRVGDHSISRIRSTRWPRSAT